jgi:small redox-active disulfide protein 2
MEIKVLGPGCPKCNQTFNLIMETLSEENIAADLDKVTDVMEIASYGVQSGVFGTPAVVIDGNVKSVGKVPKKADIIKWVKE